METTHKQIVLGILAHVDSGKTTLSEAMLYRSGAIRKLGRVDHKDAFLDTDTLEKARGITIFSKQALLTVGNTDITLLDTPGHVDFSTETERTLQVLDYAVLVVSGTDGVQSHTETLWRLLRRYHVPTFVFVNKMDLPGKSREELLAQLNHRLGEGFVAFDVPQADRDEALALCDENLMDRMLDAGQLTDADLIPAVARRHVFPCWFGSALRRTEDDALESVDALMDGIDRYTRPAPALDAFGAKVFKVSQDEQGTRLTWLRVTGGELKVKAQLSGEADGEPWEEKANQLRLYSGVKYTLAEAIGPGQVCAVTGLTKARPGEGLGAERDSDVPVLEPVLSYQVLLPEGADVHAALGKLHRLEEEEPQLHGRGRNGGLPRHIRNRRPDVDGHGRNEALVPRCGGAVGIEKFHVGIERDPRRGVEAIGAVVVARHRNEQDRTDPCRCFYRRFHVSVELDVYQYQPSVCVRFEFLSRADFEIGHRRMFVLFRFAAR